MQKIFPKNSLYSNLITEEKNNQNFNRNNNQDIEEKIKNHIKNLLEIDSDINSNVNLSNYGIDSIMAMEISSWCLDNLNIELNQIDILQGITIKEILNQANTPLDNETNNEVSNDLEEINNKKNLITSHLKDLLEIESQIDPNINIINYGIDSIMAMELSKWCTDTLNIELTQIDILQGISINQILEKFYGNIKTNTNESKIQII